MFRVAILAAALVLTGCVSDTTTGGERTQDLAPTASPSATPPQSTPEPTTGSGPCEEVMFQRAQGTIRAQQSALAQSDFEAARAYASENFRSGVSVDQFQNIIEGSYSFLLDDPALEFVDCRRQGDSALLRVEVVGTPTIVMIYGVVLENESWFIDAASVAGQRENVTT